MRVNWWLVFVLAVFFGVHLLTAYTAPSSYVWDECYYVPNAHDILNGVPSNLEHPFLTKALMALPIGLLGDGWFSWRITSIIASTFASLFTYLIARNFLTEKQSLFAVLLLNSSLIFLLVGSVGMLDMPSIAFGLAGVYYGLKNRYIFSGVFFGLSLLCKEQALLLLGGFLAYAFFTQKSMGKWRRIVSVVFLSFLVFFSGLWAYELAYRPVVGDIEVNNPITHLSVIIAYQFQLNTKVRNPDETRFYPPVSWVTPFHKNSFNPLSWYWAVYGDKLLVSWDSQPNPFIEYFMLPLLGLPLLLKLLHRKLRSVDRLVWCWLAATFLPWVLVGLFVRTEANFYIAYSIPALAVGTAALYGFIKTEKWKFVFAAVHLSLAYTIFIYYFPLVLIR